MAGIKNYFQLGASIYTPADHHKLSESLCNGIADARSIVICTEDAVSLENLDFALKNLQKALVENKSKPVSDSVIRLVRPRNAEILSVILKMDGLKELIDGFVLPKVSVQTMSEYMDVLNEHDAAHYYLLPTLETIDAFSDSELTRIRQVMDVVKDRVLCLRIGGNDLMGLMGIKRMPGLTIYDTPVRNIIDKILLAFRPYGYELSSPVFDYIDDRVTLQNELIQDINYGFFAKTAIHPSQVGLIDNAYREYLELNSELADELINRNKSAVYQRDGQMLEATCHYNWAKRTMLLKANIPKQAA